MAQVSPARETAGNALRLSAGTLLAQGILLAVAPVLTRLYEPAEVGAASVLLGLLVATGGLACLRLDMTIPLAADDEDAAALGVAGVLAAVVWAALLALAVLLLGGELADAVDASSLEAWLWLLPANALVAGAGLVAAGWAIRRKRYATLAGARAAQAGGQSAWQVAAGALGGGGGWLAAGGAAGAAAYAIVVARARSVPWRAPRERVRAAVRRWRSVAAWSATAMTMHTGREAMLPILVAALYGPGEAGLLWLAQRVLNAPVALAGDAIGSAWFGTAAALRRRDAGSLREPLAALTRPLLIWGLIATALLAAAGPPLFGAVFGEDFAEGGDLLVALAPLHASLFLAIPSGQALQAAGRTDVIALAGGGRLLVAVAAIAGGHAAGLGLTAALAVFAAGMAAVSVGIALAARRLV